MNDKIFVYGAWDDGLVLDKYTVKSVYLGDDVFGHAQFDTSYTQIGGLLHAMKYNGHFDTSREIAEICVPVLHEWLSDKKIDIILPMPPTNSRPVQPVYLIAEAISAMLRIPYSEEVLLKTDKRQAKNMPKDEKDLKGSIVQLKPAKRRCNILLIDDMYDTGETANECVAVLKQDPLVDKVYYFAVAKTK